MKKLLYLSFFIFASMLAVPALHAQDVAADDSTGLPGDDFSLQGALEMFKKSSSPEEFEKMLNTENNHVNNLDLNGDGEIDYIRVVDKSENNAHAFVLQVPVSETESQDIAVIELEKTGDASAELQIVGDEDIFGEEKIVEPAGEAGQEDAAFINDVQKSSGPSAAEMLPEYNQPRIVVNVWFWPVVRFVYAPAYTIWVSPWRWRHYPLWWHPWRPYGWHVFHPFGLPYRRSCVIVHTHRLVYAHRLYTPVRMTSVTVHTRYQGPVNHYRVTRRTTTVTGPRGNQFTRKTTTVERGHGNKKVKVTRTNGRRRRG